MALSLVWLANGCAPESSTSGGTGGSAPTGSGGSTPSGSGGSAPTGSGGSAPTGTGGSTTGTGGSTAGSGGATGTGGRTGTGGTTTGTGGAVVTGTGGATGAGGSPGVVCPSGIKSGVTACTTACGPKACGLSDLGTTNCACTGGLYVCSSCAFTFPPGSNLPPATPPPVCAAGIADKIPCATKGDLCTCDATSAGCIAGVTSTKTQVCQCWLPNTSAATSAATPFIWDCDSQPY